MALNYITLSRKNEFNSDYLSEKILNLLDQTFTIPSSYEYNVFEVNDEYVARPDLISYDAYGDSMYADVICKLNGVSNPFELGKGMKLIIPSPEDIINFHSIPVSDEVETDSIPSRDKFSRYGDRSSGGDNESLVTIKTKQSKRKANESILGDRRFRVDQTNGVVIY